MSANIPEFELADLKSMEQKELTLAIAIQLNSMVCVIKEMHVDLNGNGKPGLKAQVATLQNDRKTISKKRDRVSNAISAGIGSGITGFILGIGAWLRGYFG